MGKLWIVLGALVFLLGCHFLLGYIKPNNFDSKSYLDRRDLYETEIIRDIWGVPHIEGSRDRDVAFGFAYAQSEDHYQLIEDAMRVYRGTQSAHLGYESIPLDYLIQLLEIRKFVDEKYEEDLSPEIKAVLIGFVDGLNYWAAKNPEKVDKTLYPFTAKDLVASFSLQHLLFYGIQKPLGELFEEKRQRQISVDSLETAWQMLEGDPLPKGSNAYAVSPLRSKDGATRILINSHQPLTGPVAWYEAHLKSDEGWHVMGGAFPGSPVITVGTNEHVAWAATVNQPDLVDIYVLDINPDNENQYRLDGVWKDLVVKNAKIKVKLFGNFYWTINEALYYSEHGPVIRQDHGDYAIRYAGRGEIKQADQWYAMSKANSLDDWNKAMSQLSISSFNFIAADKNGNIGFAHNPQSPIRKEGFDWTQYLPGDRSDLIWDEYLPYEKLPQIINPNSGYLLSTNQSPFHVTAPEDNIVRSDYAETFGFPKRMTNRATRGLELFQQMDLIDEVSFKSIKFDNAYSKNARAMKYLDGIYQVEYLPDSAYANAQSLLKTWNLETDVENQLAALGVCTISEEWVAEQARRAPPPVKDEFEKCVDLLVEKFGKVDVRWGEVNRLVRGEKQIAIDGGPDVMRAIYGRGLEEDGYLTAMGGDGLFIFVSWDKDGKQKIESIHQFGSATLDKDSSHYDDQMESFVEHKMKQVFFNSDELDNNIERRYVP
ncbi:MAG: penicillin acylase family protein [Pseudomonadales bacterium]|nr:penicillin acylase family protein [Pseudomonadales bacterium]